MNAKAIGGIIVVLVVVIAVYFVFFSQNQEQELTFSEGVKQINGLWEKNKVNSAYLSSSDSELKFSSSDLDALSDDLIEFKNSLNDLKKTEDVEALKDFTEIHLLLVDELKLALELKEKNDFLGEITGDNLCLNKTDLMFVGEKTIELNNKMAQVNELVYAFNELHSGFEEQANLASFIVDASNFSQTKLENELALQELERLC
ncbi:MAG: ATP-dependent metallopeptidase FtsH/Yme1/Tma family protein [Candidatus Micrarchaeota archaeon]